jgi:bifunctional DNA-binding transcriptional regulator/antitoxin component of YhaV-PrlF toxin-antitoxin module
MFITKMGQNKIFIKKEVRKVMEIENGDYVEFIIEEIHGFPRIYIKKHHKIPKPRILGKTP